MGTETNNRKDNQQIVPYVPIFIEETDVIEGAKQILQFIRPNWQLHSVEFKKFTDGITNKLIGCFYKPTQTTAAAAATTTTTTTTTTVAAAAAAAEAAATTPTDRTTDAISTSAPTVEYQQQLTASKSMERQLVDDDGDAEAVTVLDTESVVLVRVYGHKTDLLIDRKAETENFLLLHTYNLAPALYATFKNGLAYEYVPGVTLNTDSVLHTDIWPLVACRMAEMHRRVRRVVVVNNTDGSGVTPTPMLWRKTHSFLDLVPETFTDPIKHKRLQKTFLPIARLREEFNTLYKQLKALDSPVVFCHNDLLLGNVIHAKHSKTVHFIDYEYADYNFQAFDIGNHFAELCGVEQVDYELYPKRDFQMRWLRIYLAAYTGDDTVTISDADVERLYVQVNQFALAAHIFWTVWSLIQAEHSKIDFDYVDYAYLRYNEYLRRKEEFLNLSTTTTTNTSTNTTNTTTNG